LSTRKSVYFFKEILKKLRKTKVEVNFFMADTTAIVELLRYMIIGGLKIIAPALIFSVAVALVVGVIQAVTQIQEQTLSFFPKLIALFAVFYYLGSWMLSQLVELVTEFIKEIPNLL
jgi:flagellar biosynthetic protein FliQ